VRKLALSLYRVRGIFLAAAVVPLLLVAVSGGMSLPPVVAAAKTFVVNGALLVGAVAVLLTLMGPLLLPTRETRVVRAPVEGRWLAMNSPATKVPSHGVRAYGQAYAIDLVAEPDGAERPAFGTGGPWRRSREYPAFGEPVFAMITGTVVAASDWRRDHRARSSALSLLYLMVLEAAVRELGGPGFIIGNHVVIRGDDGVFALLAHVQQGSIEVAVGERVEAGRRIARCGNSGNSTEPHVHAQLMDRAHPLTGQGLPMAFAEVQLGGGEPRDGLPANGQHLLT
jgi:hypothetical protein